jgi:NAD+ synthase
MKDKIVSWIRKKCQASKTQGIIVGLSGGIDSAVVAALAKRAVGKNKVLGVMLPCHSQQQDAHDAHIIVRYLGIRSKTIDLSKSYDAFLKLLPAGGSMARANLKPRMRMMVIYYLANKYNYLVCGTSNKSERLVGYCTKFGDSAADILPIGNLLKRQVRKLAEELGIPEHIIRKAPTAGLWPGQTDEGEMGITYNELDDILARMEGKKKQVLPREKVAKVRRMIACSEHKRQGPEMCPV